MLTRNLSYQDYRDTAAQSGIRARGGHASLAQNPMYMGARKNDWFSRR